MTEFVKLNQGWNAEPNTPIPQVKLIKSNLELHFFLNPYQFENYNEGDKGCIEFSNCSRFRFTDINDEAWYKGECRFSKLAPSWGEFYLVQRNFKEQENATPWQHHAQKDTTLDNFLFYFRDSTFECSAKSWSFKLVT
ncbi:hypothetical protein WH96_12065 [Kiloniella spongiae]|uniref:Uncharacterized protein n=1 Tax=Kiloniella spongiae TaxID=1489064 RepID=A0A0H2ME42_9PROT|nr:hypothetical protein [Kiloniella spongiae]KLN60456.1 hypothetical protein WH96_12065 [Kiloniella spongiae]